MRLPWLADVLRAEGLTVVELDGWETRGGELSTVRGCVAHHTATSDKTPDANVARLLRDGRADLKGPLSQLGLDRQGRYWVIASGRCSHNGFGEWGNQSVGIEGFNNGVGEMWPEVQLDAYRRGCAAILRRLGLPASHVKAHRETDPRRKTDPAGVGMDAFRDAVARLLRTAPPIGEEDELTADEREAVLTANHFVKEMWPDYATKIDQIHQHLEVLMKGATLPDGVKIPPVPKVVFEIAEKHGIDV